jgi:ATP-dependent 26S proteasome regulatory subunit
MNEVSKKPILIKDNNTTSIKSFHYLEDGEVAFSILKTKYSTKKLEKGIYKLTSTVKNNQWVADLHISNDREIFSDDLDFYYEDKIKNIYYKFFLPEIKEKVNKLGYNHKAGILLYGKQGTGKTSMFKKYFNDAVVKHQALVFDVKITEATYIWWKFLQDIRSIQDNPIIVFLDEFEEYFDVYRLETELKRMLDGTESIDNCLFFMTTNYIDKVPETIKDRPSRVKYKIEVTGIQDERLISQFLKQSFDKIDMEVDFEKEVSKMKGWTIDELKQWVLDKVMDIEPEQKENKKLGFGK